MEERFKLIITSPPYNLNKEYEGKMELDYYLKWQELIIKTCKDVLLPDGSVCWELGNYVKMGEIMPIDTLLYPIFKDNGFKLRNRIVWMYHHGLHSINRFSGRHETVSWYTLNDEYTFNLDDVRVPQRYPQKKAYRGKNKGKLSCNPLGKNPGDVWDITNVKHNHPEKTAHPCQFPEELVMRFVLALTNEGDYVLDPFAGSGTVGAVCQKLNRNCVLVEKEKDYYNIIIERLERDMEQPLTSFM